jgi:hypothetical protein
MTSVWNSDMSSTQTAVVVAEGREGAVESEDRKWALGWMAFVVLVAVGGVAAPAEAVASRWREHGAADSGRGIY